MKHTQAPYHKILEKQKILIAMGEAYTIKVVNGNYELISKLFNQKTFKKSEYTTDELTFIKSVRRHIVKNKIYLLPRFQENQLFSDDVHYVKVAQVPRGKVFNNVCEVDIDQAYWETAYQLGIISDSIYVKGSKGNISKKARLTALGSLAKKAYQYKFEGDKLVETITDSEPLLENLWFTICKRVSDVMHKVIESLGKEFIFYWVDGIYFKNSPELVSKTMHIFMENGYNSKFKRINQIAFHDKGFTVNDYGEIKREFSFPNYSKKSRIVSNSESFQVAKYANDLINSNQDVVDAVKSSVDKIESQEKVRKNARKRKK